MNEQHWNRLLLRVFVIGFILCGGVNVQAQTFVKWAFQTGKDIYATPIVHENVVYIGSLDSTFYAIDAQSGDEIWHFKTDQPIHSTAAIEENRICFESGNILYGLNFAGDLIWQKSLYTESVTNQIDSWDLYHSSPAIDNNVAYIGTEKGFVYGFNVQTGDEVFNWQTPGKSTIRIAPQIFENKLFVGDWAGVLYAYNLNAGELAWQYDTCDDNTYAWTNAIQTELIFANDAVYFAGRSCNAYSLNVQDGSKNWMYSDPNLWIVGGATLVHDKVLFGSSNQLKLYALDALTGEEQWIGKPDHRIWGVPALIGENVFVGAGSFYVFDSQSGEVVNRMAFDCNNVHAASIDITWMGETSPQGADALANIHSSPAIDQGVIFFGCDDGKLYAIDPEALIRQPWPESQLDDDSDLDLGEISNQDSDIQIEITVQNNGGASDSLDVSIGGSRMPEGAITCFPKQIVVAASDSQVVTVTINATLLNTKRYRPTINFESTQGLTDVRFRKRIEFTVVNESGVDDPGTTQPNDFHLSQNYPNPFNPETQVEYALPEASRVELNVFNNLGHHVRSLLQAYQSAGTHSVVWNGRNDVGQMLANGTYIIQLQSNQTIKNIKALLLK